MQIIKRVVYLYKKETQTLKIQIMKTLETKIIAQNLKNGNVRFEFPEFETSIEMHSGKHINSKDNWSQFVPHGNCKKQVEMNFLKNNCNVTLIHKPKVDEKKWPNQMKYSVVISGNIGRNGYYTTTSNMRITEDKYNELKQKYN